MHHPTLAIHIPGTTPTLSWHYPRIILAFSYQNPRIALALSHLILELSWLFLGKLTALSCRLAMVTLSLRPRAFGHGRKESTARVAREWRETPARPRVHEPRSYPVRTHSGKDPGIIPHYLRIFLSLSWPYPGQNQALSLHYPNIILVLSQHYPNIIVASSRQKNRMVLALS